MTSERLKEAVALVRQGEKDRARRILADVIRDDVHNEMAWLWYADTMPTADARVQALRECLYHNPDSEPARRGLERLGAHVDVARQVIPEVDYEEPEPEPEPEPLFEQPTRPTPPPATWADPAPSMPEPQSATRPAEDVRALAAEQTTPALRVVTYLVAGLVGAIILGYIGLLVTGFPIGSVADLGNVTSDTTALVAAIVGIVVGAAVGVLIARAILTRPRVAG